ncbi:hypothetical protein HPB48_006446 [Haemaphysalis longicornis]|uniref:Uncharacterized protein n=1 Tax=Haemaphysalis longicornis TaxID=44386 RepID=A0A9J6FMV8_HAELO|nr:hypothetical protein HPB48_006446 [Haemaphysalis longicornis]
MRIILFAPCPDYERLDTTSACGCVLDYPLSRLNENHIYHGVTIASPTSSGLAARQTGSTLDFYLIQHNQGSVAWYFWFLADFLVLIGIMSAVFLARRHFRRQAPSPDQPDDATPEPEPPHRLFGRFPLCYASWLLYSLLLVSKVVLLFRMDIAQVLKEDEVYGLQFLKAVVAVAALVFLLLVESHSEAAADSEQRTYLHSLCTGTTFEVLDSVTFLGLLFPAETHLTLTYPLENAVLALVCVNFLLPSESLPLSRRGRRGQAGGQQVYPPNN